MSHPSNKNQPTVFISSTVEDLKPYREAAGESANRAKFLPEMQEYFAAQGNNPPLKVCLQKVTACDVLIVIVAHRYGWIPADQTAGECKSITWLECEQAIATGKEVLAFIVDPAAEWDEKLKESYRITEAVNKGEATPKLLEDVQNSIKQLNHFKDWLNSKFIRNTFTSSENLTSKIIQSLNEWRQRHSAQFPVTTIDEDPRLYLERLKEDCAYIDIRGLQVGTGKAHKFDIEQLYIPLTTTGDIQSTKRTRKDAMAMAEHGRRIELHEALQQKFVTIIGDPGAGKTTFLRRIAFALCQLLLTTEKEKAPLRLGLKDALFPIFIKIGELSQYIQADHKSDKPALPTDPTWLCHFLADRSCSQNWGLSQAYFLEKFKSGKAIILFDGLDETPDRKLRETISELVTQAIAAYARCKFVVSCRPHAYTGRAVLQKFHQYTIDALDDKSVEQFLQHWSQALHKNQHKAASHHQELMEALKSRPEIRRMASNPVMLTALAVVHWNEHRMPEQRVDLYESIITWLLRSREQRPDRMDADICRILLQNLALAMQTHEDGRQVQIGRRCAAEAIEQEFQGKNKEHRIVKAEQFLAEEEVDSGIVVGRGNNITFWHLTFQEYLAAKALGGKVEQAQQKLLVQPKILHNPDWREVLLLFGGVLYRQGLDKVNNFFKAILDTVPEKGKKLSDEARCVGLIGAMLRDLQPFKYQLNDSRYHDMLDRIIAIFNRDKAQKIDVKIRLEAADALGQAGDPRLNKENMILIPKSTFLMGAQRTNEKEPNYDRDALTWESPVHEVKLSPFRINRFLVTVFDYSKFIENGGYDNEKYWQAGGWKQFDAPQDWDKQLPYPTRPVVGVSWYEAMAYARWADKTLPTEAQWERAARGPDGSYRKYPWGNHQPDANTTNWRETKLGHASPVGMFPNDCTNEGLLDMGGNVCEWCLDWIDSEEPDKNSVFYEKSNNSVDPLNDEKGDFGKIGNSNMSVVRGGSWGNYGTDFFRCAFRSWCDPGVRSNDLGFRVACSAQFLK